jgi:EAL domain-containing protein (putative c-di-GMP-specific phosphodiesterase class I)
VRRLLAAIRVRDGRIGARPPLTASAHFPGLDLDVGEVTVETDMGLDEDVSWANRIRDALDGELLQLQCQPVVSLRTRSIVQWELLVRLEQTEGWLLPPASFLAAAERCGLAGPLDAWVIGRAIELLRDQPSTGPGLRLEVNLCARSLSSAAFAEQVEAKIASSGVSPESLIFAIPQLAAPSEIAAAAGFGERLARLGCLFALDHFGTGPSHLVQLAELPIACVKIDGRLVHNLTAEPSNQAVVKNIARMLGGTGISSIAMHVSDEPTVELLRDYGIDCGQGWHLGKPRPLAELS